MKEDILKDYEVVEVKEDWYDDLCEECDLKEDFKCILDECQLKLGQVYKKKKP